MKRLATLLALVSVFWLGGNTASADILQLNARVQVGAAHGLGMGGAQKDNAFHAGAKGLAYGAAVGVEFLLLDGWVEHYQYQGQDGLIGTWTQFMAGVDKRFSLGDKKGAVDGKGGYSSMYGEIGAAIGFGVGTGQQVVLPLDNSQVSDKGFMAQVHLAFGYRLSKNLSLGLMIPVQGAYLFKQGNGISANDEGTHYQSMQGSALLNLRLDIPIK